MSQSSIQRSPSQIAFDQAVHQVAASPDVSKSNTVFVDYFKSQPQDTVVAKGRGLMDRALQLPQEDVAGALARSIGQSLRQVSKPCANARTLIDNLGIERDVQQTQNEIKDGFARLGVDMRQALDRAIKEQKRNLAELQKRMGAQAPASTPPIYPDLPKAFRDSGALDDAMIALAEKFPAPELEALLKNFAGRLLSLAQKLRELTNAIVRMQIAVSEQAKVPPLSAAEQADYAKVRAWLKTMQPQVFAALCQAENPTDETRAAVPAAQLQASVVLSQRATLTMVHEFLSHEDMETLRQAETGEVGAQLRRVAETVRLNILLAFQHVAAPMLSVLKSVEIEKQKAGEFADMATNSGYRLFSDIGAAALKSDTTLVAFPFLAVGSAAAEALPAEAPPAI